MKNYCKCALPAALVILLYPPLALHSSEGGAFFHKIDPGKIIIHTGDSIKTIPVDGTVEKSYQNDGCLYYIRTKEESGAPAAFIGCIDEKSPEIQCEMRLPFVMNEASIRKFAVNREFACILAKPKSPPNGSGTLYRISTGNLQVTHVPDVVDLYGSDNDIVLLVKTGSGTCVVLDGITVPVSIKGDLEIRKLVDSRLVFIGNGIETEIIDIRAAIGLYQYSSKYEYVRPDNYNVAIQIADEAGAGPENDEIIFFRVFINGIESGRTGTGPAKALKEFKTIVDPNKEHLVQLERWVLNSLKARYDRANKISQPRAYQVFMPLNRVINIKVRYTGKSYLFDAFPLYR